MNSKIITRSLAGALLSLIGFMSAASQGGSYDPGFGGTGMVRQGLKDHYITGASNRLQPDGKIVSAGYFSKDEQNGIALTRHNPDGTPDRSFGVDGVVITPKKLVAGGMDYYLNMVADMALQADGKIIVAGGSIGVSGNIGYMICRYKANGTLDSSFGSNGFIAAINALEGVHCQAYGVAVQADGKIVAVGSAAYMGIGVVRYKENGTPDSSFGTNGLQTIEVGHYRSEGTDLAIQSDGKIVLSGSAATATVTAFAVVRLLPDGTPDDLFGTHGKVMTLIGDHNSNALAVIVGPSGKIMVAGSSDDALYTDFALAIYNPDGSLVKTTTADINTYGDYASSVALQQDGRIVLGGYAEDASLGHMALARFNPDGTLDKSFATAGKLFTPLATGNFDLTGLLIQPDDKIVCTGTAQDGDSSKMAIVRVLQGPELGIFSQVSNATDLSVYPNPVVETTTLSYTLNDAATVAVSLLDIQGRLVQEFLKDNKQAAGAHQLSLQIPDQLAPGLYTLVLSTADGRSAIAVRK